MPITVVAPGGPTIMGPGSLLAASSDVLGLANPPYLWSMTLSAPEFPNFLTMSTTTQAPLSQARFRILEAATGNPLAFTSDIHHEAGTQITTRVEVRNDLEQLLDTPLTTVIRWEPVAFLNASVATWARWTVAEVLGGAAGGDKIDRILAAVYRTWPSA